jgi:hypothetical protein
MQRIHAHLPAAIKHLRWAYLSLIALLASLVSTQAAHAAVPAKDAPDLHTSRDGSVMRQAVRAVLASARQTADRALALHKVTAGESISSVAVNACHGHADYWTGIYAESRAEHLTAYNANVLNVGQLLAIDCVYMPQELKYAVSAPHRHWHQAATTAYVSGGGHHDRWDGHHYPGGCGDGDGDGLGDMPCSMLHHSAYAGPVYRHAGHIYRRVSVSSGGSYRGSSSFERCVIARESGGNSQIMNASGHYGLYQFSASTWQAYGGSSGSFGHASVGEQRRVFLNAIARGGQSNWSPYDGC